MLRETQEQLEDLRASHETTAKEASDTFSKLTEMKTQYAILLKEETHLKQNIITPLESQNKELVTQVSTIQKTLTQVQEEAATFKATTMTQCLQVKSQKSANEVLERNLSEREAHFRESEAQTIQKVMLLEGQLAHASAQAKSLQLSLKETSERNVKEHTEWEKKLTSATYNIARLEEQFEKAEAWRCKESQSVKEKEVLIKKLNIEVGEARKELQCSIATVTVAELEKKNQVLLVHSSKLQEDNNRLVKALKDSEESMNKAQIHFEEEMASELPKIARSATERASEEWQMRHEEKIKALHISFDQQLSAVQADRALMEATSHGKESGHEASQKHAEMEVQYLKREVAQLERNNTALLNQLDVLRMFHTSTLQMQNQMAVPPGLSKIQDQLERVHADVENLWQTPSSSWKESRTVSSSPSLSPPRSAWKEARSPSMSSQATRNSSDVYVQEQYKLDQARRRRAMDYSFEELTPISSRSSSSYPESYGQEHFKVEQALRRRAMDYHFQEKEKPKDMEFLDLNDNAPLSTSSLHGATYPQGSSWYQNDYWKTKYTS